MIRKVLPLIKKSDVVIEVVDARIPFDSRCRELEKLVRKLGKKLMIAVNKSDLADEGFLREVCLEIERDERIPCAYVSSKTRKGLRTLREKLKKVVKTIRKDKVFVCVVGYANTGKSSLINALRGRHVAGTAPIPGWTKGEQLVKLSRRVYLIDTPGVIPLEREKAELLGLVRPEKVLDPVRIATYILSKFIKEFPEEIKRVYKLERVPESPEKILEEIARRLGKFKKGGELDLEETGRKIISDWITGKLKGYFIKFLTPQSK